MKYTVICINVIDNSPLETFQFDSYDEAYEFASNLNEIFMNAPIRYQVQN
jgi:hypothetical protein